MPNLGEAAISAPRLALSCAAIVALLFGSAPVFAQDADICMAAAERVADGETLAEPEKSNAHEACQRALAETSSIMDKYHLQEADFDITGTRPKQ